MSIPKNFLIIGLGNPGKKYEKTRHNVGFLATDFLLTHHFNDKTKGRILPRLQSWVATHKNIIFAKPQTFMNNSGVAVQKLAHYYKIKPQSIIIIYDEIDLPFGTIRVRDKGSAAGHKGVQSIINHLSTDKFWRIRIGIANKKTGGVPAEKFVLQKLSKTELKELEEKIFNQVIIEVEKIIRKN